MLGSWLGSPKVLGSHSTLGIVLNQYRVGVGGEPISCLARDTLMCVLCTQPPPCSMNPVAPSSDLLRASLPGCTLFPPLLVFLRIPSRINHLAQNSGPRILLGQCKLRQGFLPEGRGTLANVCVEWVHLRAAGVPAQRQAPCPITKDAAGASEGLSRFPWKSKRL